MKALKMWVLGWNLPSVPGHKGERSQFHQWRQGAGVRKTFIGEVTFQLSPGPNRQVLCWGRTVVKPSNSKNGASAEGCG